MMMVIIIIILLSLVFLMLFVLLTWWCQRWRWPWCRYWYWCCFDFVMTSQTYTQPATWNEKTQKSFSLKLCKNRTSFRASFNWVSKVIRNGFSFAFPRRVTGPDNSRHFFQPTRSKLKPIETQSLAFSRALYSLLVLNFRSHWLLVTFSFLWLVVN